MLLIMANGACITRFIHIALSQWKWQHVEYVALQKLVIVPLIVHSGLSFFNPNSFYEFYKPANFRPIYSKQKNKNYYNRLPTDFVGLLLIILTITIGFLRIW